MTVSRRSILRSIAVDIAGVAIAAALIAYGAYSYVSHERAIYSWDDANYSSLAERLYLTVFPAGSVDLLAGLNAIYASFGAEYSYLFAVPVVLAERWFGLSREVFISSMALFWFMPYCVAWGLVATRTLTIPPRRAFWWAFALAIALPLTWMSVMHGYPDAGAAAIMGFAVYLYLTDTHLTSWKRCVTIGLLLCLLPLFRRHYVFGVVSFAAGALLQQAWTIAGLARAHPRDAFQAAARRAGRLTVIGASAAVALLTIGRPFVLLVWSNNYFSLYSGWMIPAQEMAAGWISAYGVLVASACVIGYVWGFRLGVLRHEAGLFLAATGLVSVLLWVFVVRQLGLQYTVHFTPFVVIGFLALMVCANRVVHRGYRAAAFVGGAALLVYRLGVGLAIVGPVDSPNGHGVLMARNPPQVRRDYGEIKRIVTDLRLSAHAGATVYVASSSWTLNADILRRAEIRFFGPAFIRLHVPEPAEVDSRDWYPVESLMKADYVAIALPPQYSLHPVEQKTIRLVTDAFADGLPIARTFEAMSETYVLENGAMVHLFRRAAPTDVQAALQELSREEKVLRTRPGRQGEWLSLDFDRHTTVAKQANGWHRIVLSEPTSRTPLDATRSRRLFVRLDDPWQKGEGSMQASYSLDGTWMDHTVTVRAWLADPDSGAEVATGTPVRLGGTSGQVSIPIPQPPAGKVRLVLELVTPEADAAGAMRGSVTLFDLTVR